MYYLLNLLSQNKLLVSHYLIENSQGNLKVRAQTRPYYIKEAEIFWETPDVSLLVGSVNTFLDNFSSPLNQETTTIELKEGYAPIFTSKKGRLIDKVMRINGRLEELSWDKSYKILASI